MKLFDIVGKVSHANCMSDCPIETYIGRLKMKQTKVVAFDDHRIGQGYNSQTQEKVGTPLIVDGAGEDPLADGQRVDNSFELVTTQESLMTALGIDVSLDARYGLFSGGAKMSFAENDAVNSFSSYLVARCLVQNATRYGQGFSLTPEAKVLLDAQRLADFQTAYGDMFVRSLKTGGEFYAIVRVTSTSSQDQQSVSASLQAEYNGLAASGSFSSAFKDSTERTHGETSVTVWISQAGGQGDQASYTGQEAAQVIARMKEFPGIVHQHATGCLAELATYNTIPLPLPTEEELEAREMALRDCVSQKMKLLTAIQDIGFALNPDDAKKYFVAVPSKDVLLQASDKYRAALSLLLSHAIKVSTGKIKEEGQWLWVRPTDLPVLNLQKKEFVDDTVVIPDFTVYRTVDDAAKAVSDLGLVPKWIVKDGANEEAVVRVVSQDPIPGVRCDKGKDVTLFTTKPKSGPRDPRVKDHLDRIPIFR